MPLTDPSARALSSAVAVRTSVAHARGAAAFSRRRRLPPFHTQTYTVSEPPRALARGPVAHRALCVHQQSMMQEPTESALLPPPSPPSVAPSSHAVSSAEVEPVLPQLHRGPSIEGIERRAVSASFLRQFTQSRVLANAALNKRCAEVGAKFLEQQIEQLENERDVLQQNIMCRSATVGSVDSSSGESKNEPTFDEGARLAQLGRRIDLFKFDLAQRKSCAYMTTRDVHRELVKVEVDALRCRYVELPIWLDGHDEDGTPFVGLADFFVSHSWDSPWEAVVNACLEHSAALPAGASKPYYWIDIFAVNQHTPTSQHCSCDGACVGCMAMKEDLPDWHLMQASHDVGFERVIRTTRKTLLVMDPWFAPRPPTRVWCLYESYITLQQPGGELIVALGREQRRSMQMALQANFGSLEEMIGRLDARNADVTVESDRTNIFGAIEKLKLILFIILLMIIILMADSMA